MKIGEKKGGKDVQICIPSLRPIDCSFWPFAPVCLLSGDPVGPHWEVPEGDLRGDLSHHRSWVPLLPVWRGQSRGGVQAGQGGPREGTVENLRYTVAPAKWTTQFLYHLVQPVFRRLPLGSSTVQCFTGIYDVSALKPIVTRGQYFHFWKKNVPVVNGLFCKVKMPEYAYNWQLRIENTKVSKNIVCEYNRTDIAGETLRKIQTGSASYFETVVFLCTPIGHGNGYQPYSLFYVFPKMSTAFWRSFTPLCWRMSVNDYIA